jgi:hypothetical protein
MADSEVFLVEQEKKEANKIMINSFFMIVLLK